MPDFRGLFLRGHGSQAFNSGGYGNISHASETLGTVQGDAIRNITGRGMVHVSRAAASEIVSGAIAHDNGNARGVGDSDNDNPIGTFNASLVVPTAPENRPVNMAVRYLIRAVK